jgi:hypothetical protein
VKQLFPFPEVTISGLGTADSSPRHSGCAEAFSKEKTLLLRSAGDSKSNRAEILEVNGGATGKCRCDGVLPVLLYRVSNKSWHFRFSRERM